MEAAAAKHNGSSISAVLEHVHAFHRTMEDTGAQPLRGRGSCSQLGAVRKPRSRLALEPPVGLHSLLQEHATWTCILWWRA